FLQKLWTSPSCLLKQWMQRARCKEILCRFYLIKALLQLISSVITVWPNDWFFLTAFFLTAFSNRVELRMNIQRLAPLQTFARLFEKHLNRISDALPRANDLRSSQF